MCIKKMTKKQKLNAQLWLGFLMVLFGIVLIVASFVTPPLGVIHASVLAAFGEILTFAGCLLGLDYHYAYKVYIRNKDKEDDEEME